jgi:hypothetical protein
VSPRRSRFSAAAGLLRSSTATAAPILDSGILRWDRKKNFRMAGELRHRHRLVAYPWDSTFGVSKDRYTYLGDLQARQLGRTIDEWRVLCFGEKKSTRCVGGHASGQLHDIVPRRQRVEEPLICHLATLPTTLHKNKGKGGSRRVVRSCLVAMIALGEVE